MLLIKISIGIGLCLLLLGIYFHLHSDYMASLGVTGILISATCFALAIVFSLPTKLYLTFLLMKREAEQRAKKSKKPQD